MKTISIPIPDQLPQSLKMSDEEFRDEARFLLASKLYEAGKVSAGVAAEVAGTNRLLFLSLLGRHGAPAINLLDEEVRLEIEAARRLSEA